MQRQIWSNLRSTRGLMLPWILLSGWVRDTCLLFSEFAEDKTLSLLVVSLTFSFAGPVAKTQVGCASDENEGEPSAFNQLFTWIISS